MLHRVLCALGLTLALLAAGCAGTRTAPSRTEADVRALLDAQVVAWNQGDIEGFMQGYWQSDSLRFASGGTVRYGWQTTLSRYRQGYPDRAAMGTLTFDSLSIRPLDARHAYAFGRWSLARDASFAPASGLFTLLLRRFPHGWRIVHDHTSSSP